MKECVAAIDQGTSSSRVLIIDAHGKVLGSHQKEHQQFYPAAGQVEHDPLEIWNNVRECLTRAIDDTKQKVNVVSIGITNQRETSIVWNKKTGKPYHRAIVWNDTRTGEIAAKLSKDGGADRFRKKTGLPIASYFSATKLMYLLEHVPKLRHDAEKGDALFGTMDTWLIWNLTQGKVHATDVTNASRTLFMDLHTLMWDEEILKELKIPEAMLPQICPSSHIFGHVDAEQSRGKSRDGDDGHYSQFHDVPIGGVLGDQNAALFGQACYEAGDSKCTYGTGAFMLFNTGEKVMQSKHGLLTTVAYQLGSPKGGKHSDSEGKPQNAVYALEGSVAYSGSVIQWLRDNLQVISEAKESESLARSVPDNGGVYFVPAFAGLYAPYWRGDARGVLTGLTAYNTKAHLVRAALEASAFQTVDVAHAMMEDTNHRMTFSDLRVDGGLTKNGLLMQFLADVLNVPIVRPVITETTALGAAFVAGLAVGLWKDTAELKGLWKAGKTWEPTMTVAQRKKLMANWHKAVDRSMNWVDENTRDDSGSGGKGGSGKSSRSSKGDKGGSGKAEGGKKATEKAKDNEKENGKHNGEKSGHSKAGKNGGHHVKASGKTKEDNGVHKCFDGYAGLTRTISTSAGGYHCGTAAVGTLGMDAFSAPLAIATALRRAAMQVRLQYQGYRALTVGAVGAVMLPAVRTLGRLLRGRRW